MKHSIGDCRIYTAPQLERYRWWCFLQGFAAGAGIATALLWWLR